MRRQWQLGSTVRTSRQWPQRGARSGSSACCVLSALLAPVMAFGGMTVPANGGRKCGGVGGGNRCGQVGTGKRIDDVFGFGTGIPQQRQWWFVLR